MNTTTQRNIQNPEKWIGKYVRHMANWRDFDATDDKYFICEETGKLTRMSDEGYWGEVWATKEEAEAAGYDECYYYSKAGLMALAGRPARATMYS